MQARMMRIAAFGAAFLAFARAIFPEMSLGKATIALCVFIDDRPLVIGIGVFQHEAVGSWMIVGEAMFGAPSTPRFVCFGRGIAVSWYAWRMVDSFRRVDVECGGMRRAP